MEEEGNSVFEKDKNVEKDMQEKDKEKFHNNDSELSDKRRDICNNNIQDKDIDSSVVKDIKSKKPNLDAELIRNQVIIRENEQGDEDEEEEDNEEEGEYSNITKEMNKKRTKRKKKKEKKNKEIKLKLIDKKDFHVDEGEIVIKDKQNKNNREIRVSEFSNKDSNTISELNKKQEDTDQKAESISFIEIIKNPSTPFAYYYWKLFQLKQPIVALFSPIKFLKIEESYIPTLVKIMRIIFILSLNIFFNILHLEQKYFRKKFVYFNDKYKLRYTFLEEKISSFELFSYGFNHAYVAAFISFLVCLIIQSVLNYFFFDLKKKLNVNIENKTNEQTVQLLENTRKSFINFFAISLGIMVIIFYASINFAQVYRGGVLDLIAGVLWTFIFLQIIPFILCLVFALIRYYGVKKNEKILIDLSLSVFF